MKILEAKYPMGTIPRQQTAGRYINELLYENLKVLAKSMNRDMTFFSIFYSSTLEVGTGKSTLMQQVAEAWASIINEMYHLNLQVDMNNIVFKPRDLIERSFKLPRYSPIILDEWEDLHYWSELGVSLRQFFRKCRQLNLFIMVAIPNFFQMPMNYAISRSIFAVDVKFSGEFERGYFSFYNFNDKKNLYIYGKKTQNYSCTKPSFHGRFLEGYVVNEEEYRKAKMNDMIESEKNEKKRDTTWLEFKAKVCQQLNERLPHLSVKELAFGFKVDSRTIYRWLNREIPKEIDEIDTFETAIINDSMHLATLNKQKISAKEIGGKDSSNNSTEKDMENPNESSNIL